MGDNLATVENLELQQIRLFKDGEPIKLNVDFKMDMVINEHTSTFIKKGVVPDLPANLQADVENLWNDIYELIHDFYDLDLG